jgi:RND family efflux transporter MFP subunit
MNILAAPPRVHIATLALLLVSGCTTAGADTSGERASRSAPASQKLPDARQIRVEVALVQPSQTRLNLVRPGEVNPSREVHIASAMGGIVEAVGVDEGEFTRKGQLLAQVDTSVHEAQRALAQVEADDARREHTRLLSMGAAIPRQRIDQAKTRLDRAEAQLRLAGLQKQRTRLRSTVPGLVAEVNYEVGEYAPPGGAVARVVQLDPVHVEVSVADRDVNGLSLGGQAQISTSGNPNPVDGKITRIGSTADLKTRTFKVEVEVSNSEQTLRPGMIASVRFTQGARREGIVIPQDFLVTQIDQNGVFVADDDNVARWRPLTLGGVIRDQVVVADGLKPGERVVVVGQRALVDGDPLLIAREGVCCTDGRVISNSTELSRTQPTTEVP